jgi:hypothetical protein
MCIDMAHETQLSVIASVALAGVCLAVTFVPSTIVLGVLIAVPVGALGIAACCSYGYPNGSEGSHED